MQEYLPRVLHFVELHGNVPVFSFMKFPPPGQINDYTIGVLTTRITVWEKNESTE